MFIVRHWGCRSRSCQPPGTTGDRPPGLNLPATATEKWGLLQRSSTKNLYRASHFRSERNLSSLVRKRLLGRASHRLLVHSPNKENSVVIKKEITTSSLLSLSSSPIPTEAFYISDSLTNSNLPVTGMDWTLSRLGGESEANIRQSLQCQPWKMMFRDIFNS